MLKVLEFTKKTTIEDGKITVSSEIKRESFAECGRDRDNHSMFFSPSKPITFTGTVVLKDGDESNEVEAERIAEAKTERAYYKYIKRCQKNSIKSYTESLNKLTEALTRTETNIKKTNSHIEEICKRL